jgi:NIMA (never in mitosis gene a)-related kinase 1/4/5
MQGVDYMHNRKILHRDIKPMNVFIGKSDVVKIGDLGIAKIIKNNAAAETQIGTPHFMAPEIWRNEPYSYAADVWSLGCLLYEMLTYKVRRQPAKEHSAASRAVLTVWVVPIHT